MFSPDQYRLADFGAGRKLERFGAVLVDRPSPAATGAIRDRELWSSAARFVAGGDEKQGVGRRGHWQSRQALPDPWTIENPPLVFQLRLTEFGHVGIFPEQADNWNWIAKQVDRLARGARASGPNSAEAPRVLNLFAYTGASTLAAAAVGAAVVHVDASTSTVAWARRNAELSGLPKAPIRWIVEDAARFAARELKRGSRYHGVVLDPPSYGHGPKGKVWQIERDLPPLLEICGKLLTDEHGFVLLSCHSPGIGPADLKKQLSQSVAEARKGETDVADLVLMSSDGRGLHSGVSARWTRR